MFKKLKIKYKKTVQSTYVSCTVLKLTMEIKYYSASSAFLASRPLVGTSSRYSVSKATLISLSS